MGLKSSLIIIFVVAVGAVVFVVIYNQEEISNNTNTQNVNTQSINTNVSVNLNTNIQTRQLPDEELCNNNENGWQCKLVPDDYIGNFNDDWEMFRQVDNDYKKSCENQDGEWTCYGLCMPSYDHYCDFPYTDVGSECSNSDQCAGKCIVGTEYVDNTFTDREGFEDIIVGTDFVGSCAEYPLRECDWWYELNDGKIENHTGILCD
ncbi:hypothetical protein ACFL04_02335 [Patescibacteria group bacterium]